LLIFRFKYQLKKRETILLFLLVLMLTGCLLSRSVLSVSTILFIGLACIHKGFVSQIKKAFTNPLTFCIMLLFFIPFISGLWSSDIQTWRQVIQDKLPLLLLPIAFSGNWKFGSLQWKIFIWTALSLIALSTIWSTGQYLVSSNEMEESYLRSKLIPVPVFGDHIRFSWLVCAGYILSIYLAVHATNRKLMILYFILSAWLFIFLHVLAARTGLVGSYVFILIWSIYSLFKNKKNFIHYIVLFSIPVLTIMAWYFFPTLQNRFRYMKYNLSYIAKNDYLPHSNDGNRILSLKAGWTILKENPFGIGAGDVKNEVSGWYDAHIMNISEEDKIFPSNEWLIHGDVAGWPGILVFSIAFFSPLLYRVKEGKVFVWGLHAVAFIACFFDSSLEVQAGIFIYCFIVLLWWKRLKDCK